MSVLLHHVHHDHRLILIVTSTINSNLTAITVMFFFITFHHQTYIIYLSHQQSPVMIKRIILIINHNINNNVLNIYHPSSCSQNITPYCPMQPLYRCYMWIYISGTLPRVPNSSDDITKHCRLVAFYSDEEAAVADVLLEASAMGS